MQIELNKLELMSWLKAITGVTIVSISLVAQVDKIWTNITSPAKLSKVFEQQVGFLDGGPYLVEYESTKDDNDQDIPYTTFAMAMTFKAESAKHPGIHMGGYDGLIRALSGYEYLSRISQESYGLVGHLLVLLPQEPSELAALQEILVRHSVMYAFPDGTRTLNLNNVKMGRGVQG